MNRLPENTVIVGKGIELELDEVSRLEIEMIEKGHLLENDRLMHDETGGLVVKYENSNNETGELGVRYENNNLELMKSGSSSNASQVDAIRKLEQLQIKTWSEIKPFYQDFMYYSTKAGCFYDKTIGEKLFLKLPEPLGSIIHKKYNEQVLPKTLPQFVNIATKIKFIDDQFEEKRTELQIIRELNEMLIELG